jgi:hypothetical protein
VFVTSIGPFSILLAVSFLPLDCPFQHGAFFGLPLNLRRHPCFSEGVSNFQLALLLLALLTLCPPFFSSGVQPPPPAPGVVPIASTPIGVPINSGTTPSAPSSTSASGGGSGSSISAGAIVGIVIAAVVGGLILLCVAGGVIVLRRRRNRGHKSVDDGDRSGQDGLSKSFREWHCECILK